MLLTLNTLSRSVSNGYLADVAGRRLALTVDVAGMADKFVSVEAVTSQPIAMAGDQVQYGLRPATLERVRVKASLLGRLWPMLKDGAEIELELTGNDVEVLLDEYQPAGHMQIVAEQICDLDGSMRRLIVARDHKGPSESYMYDRLWIVAAGDYPYEHKIGLYIR